MYIVRVQASRYGPSVALNVVNNQFQKICIDLEMNPLSSVIHNMGAAGVAGGIGRVAGKKTFVCDAVSTAPMTEQIRAGGPVDFTSLQELTTSFNGGARCTIDVTGVTMWRRADS